MNPITGLPAIVGALPNYGKILILLGVAVVFAAIPATAKVGFGLAVVLAIMFVVSLVTGRQFTWDGRSAPLGSPGNPVQQAT